MHSLTTTRYPQQDRVMFLLSLKAGLRAKERTAFTWARVTEADRQVGEVLQLVNTAGPAAASTAVGARRRVAGRLSVEMLAAALVDPRPGRL